MWSRRVISGSRIIPVTYYPTQSFFRSIAVQKLSWNRSNQLFKFAKRIILDAGTVVGGIFVSYQIHSYYYSYSIPLKSVSASDMRNSSNSEDMSLIAQNKFKHKQLILKIISLLLWIKFNFALSFASAPLLLHGALYIITSVALVKVCTNLISLTTFSEHAIKYVPFNQYNLIDPVNANISQTDCKFGGEGMCLGLTTMWFIYQLLGRNLITELTAIKRTLQKGEALTIQQKYLLQDILSIQNNQFVPLHICEQEGEIVHNQFRIHPRVGIFTLINDFLIRFGIKKYDFESFIDFAFKKALANQGHLVGIMLINDEKDDSNYIIGHIIGLTAKSYNNKTLIRYFDSNFQEAICEHPEVAKADILRLLKGDDYYQNFSQLRVVEVDFEEKYYRFFWRKKLIKQTAQHNEESLFKTGPSSLALSAISTKMS